MLPIRRGVEFSRGIPLEKAWYRTRLSRQLRLWFGDGCPRSSRAYRVSKHEIKHVPDRSLACVFLTGHQKPHVCWCCLANVVHGSLGLNDRPKSAEPCPSVCLDVDFVVARIASLRAKRVMILFGVTAASYPARPLGTGSLSDRVPRP
jgi:hypothetical protein